MPTFYLICLVFVLSAGTALSQATPPPADNSTTIDSSMPSTVTKTVFENATTTVFARVKTTTVFENATTTTVFKNITTTVFANTTSSGPSTTTLPTVSGSQIHPNGNKAKCLDVRGAVFANGTPVQIFDCNGTPAQNWVLNSGRGHVVLAGTTFCLDAGSQPANGVGMKIWKCFDNLPAQDWFYTGDQRIALTNQGFCLDLTNGNLVNSNRVQTWKCTDFNRNQIWTL